jgi:hypothetical protein
VVCKNVNAKAEEATALEAVARRQPVKINAVVNCRVCELAISLQLLIVTICDSSINLVTNTNSVCIYSYT